MNIKNILVLTNLIIFFVSTGFAQQPDPLQTNDHKAQQEWVDSIMQKMSLQEKIGQLFMVAAYSNPDSPQDEKHQKYIENLIENYHIGGLIFMQGTPYKQAVLNNHYQSISKTPLLIGFDGEWGLDMRLDSTYRYPWNMTLGAIKDNQLIREMGKRIGEQHKRLGIHVNFAPVVDINTNPENPIIGNRSFGENPQNVSDKALAFMQGIQETGVLACAKHFPGHGDTQQDSHKTLPTVTGNWQRLDSIELYPYKKLIESGLSAIMTAHLRVPALEKKKIPASISRKIVHKLLKEKMGFNGLIFTDALNMKGITKFGKEGEIELAAFKAGNDILLFSQNIPAAVTAFERALKRGKIKENDIDETVKKILKAKYKVGLAHQKKVLTKNLYADLNQLSDTLLHRKLVNASITLLQNKEVVPVYNVNQKIAYVKLGNADAHSFLPMLQNYTEVSEVEWNETALSRLKEFDLVIVGFHKSNANPWKSYKFSKSDLKILHKIAKQNKVILSVFASPYSLLEIKDFTDIEALILSYQNSAIAQEMTAQKIFGALEITGNLPVRIPGKFEEASGIFSPNIKRFSYGIPEEVGMSSKALKRVDSIAREVVKQEMAPGLQILIARKGKVIYDKAFGYYTFDKKQKVTYDSRYDLASITKITGALPLLMKAYEEGKFDLDDPLGKHMHFLQGTNKDTITFKEALSHVARLQAWIPFYLFTIDSLTKKPVDKYYRKEYSKEFSIPVAKNMYLRTDYKDSIYQKIIDSELREKNGYKYSGLIFYLAKKYLEELYRKDMKQLTDSLFYKPLGANKLSYKPLQSTNLKNIVPTEKDTYYRNQLLQGYVHDQGAAMLGGVNGNAGLFSNANDLAKMMQMYLQGGFYGGKRYLKSNTINTFNKRYFEKDSVRRGLGFDKPQLDPEILATCGCVSDKSFGHSGFTGTYVWADPETGLLYVFLSNRVYPTMGNTKLVDEDIRTKTQQIVVDAIIDKI